MLYGMSNIVLEDSSGEFYVILLKPNPELEIIMLG